MYSATGEGETFPSSTSSHSCHHFSLAEIQTATNDFDDELIIGRGGFGKVYKGPICIKESSHVVAIKRLDPMSNQGAPEFKAEIEMLSKLRHCHLVSLLGYCEDSNEMVLVYEYMPHGTLYDHLHNSNTPLNWVQRLKIAIGAARGLDYLHTGVGTQHGVIHRDVKSANILLDESWAAKISDFGLSKIGPTNQSFSYVDASVKGTFGYLDPEYFYTRKLTRKTDVFAFGVVLFELLSGRLPVDIRHGEEQCSLVRWAQKCVKERKLDQLVDSYMIGTISMKCLRQFAQIAYRCLLSVPKERPTMTEVVASLQALLELQNRSDATSMSPGIMGFTWKIHKYFIPATKTNSDPSGTNSLKSYENHVNQHEELEIRDLKMFKYDELKLATRDFGCDTYLGMGSYGFVYTGWVDKTTYSPCKDDTGLPILVKKLHRYEFFDLEMLKEFRHPNLVKLIGYGLFGKKLFLVHEFMHNRNFVDLRRSGVVAQLPLVTKVKIVVGIARAIVFLHKTQLDKTWDKFESYTWESGPVSESQLRRHKILLDENFTPKLSGYDVSLLVKGYYHRVEPDIDSGELQLKTNLSGYEVVFVEVLTGEEIYSSNRLARIDRLFSQCGKESLCHIAKLCFEICNELDSESKMLTILREHDELIRTRLESWLLDPQSRA